MRKAWNSMWAELRAHEAKHEAIANRWRGTLRERLAALNLEVTADNRDEAAKETKRLANVEWTTWIAEHQAEQNKIDPFIATLVCPDEKQSTEGEGGSILGKWWTKIKSWFSND